MKDLKSLNTIEMGIDVNDLKILINAGFQYLMKTCHQWAKDHPLVSGVLLFFYLLYIFFPYLFNILFYTFPLVICTAILLGGPHIRTEKHHRNTRDIKKEDDKTSIDNGATTTYHRRRPYLQPQLSKRTFGKEKSKEVDSTEDISNEENKDHTEAFPMKDDPIVHESRKLEEKPMKTCKEDSLSHSLRHVKTSSSLDNTWDNHFFDKMENFSRSASHSDTESPDEEDDDEPHEAINKVVQWTEDDQRNLMDLGTSEIERNKRLESLIAKRRARKLLSMQPRRNHFDHLGGHHPYDYHIDSQGSIMVEKDTDEGEHQPGSAPSVLLPTRNPFDLPYDPHEEKPILTGGSFEEEFFGTEQRDTPFCNHESFSFSGGATFIGEFKDDHISKSLPSFFMKPRAPEKPPGFSRFRRESDAEESVKEFAEELAREGNNQTQDSQESSQEVQLSQVQSDCHDQAPTSNPEEEESQILEKETLPRNNESIGSDRENSVEGQKEEELQTRENEEENIFQMDSEPMALRNQVQQTQDQLSVNKDDDECEESSSSSSCETGINATKNEAFRNSVRKVLTCLVRNKDLAGKEKAVASSSDILYDSSPTSAIPTKMEERSYYTSRPRHTPTYSIASDMQVEVSDGGSPTAALDPSSPTDRESLYDGDVDKDVNSGDEDLWGTSPHPMRLGDFGGKFKLPDIIEESNSRGSAFGISHNASNCPTSSRGQAEEPEQGQEEGTTSSLSPRSILPEENRKDLIDHKSTDGDIMEPRSSVSSSSEGLASQVQGKSEQVAEYLANLPRRGTGYNAFQDPGPSHVRKISAEEINIQDESNSMFEMDEDKEESKDSKELGESQESIEQSTITSQTEAPKAASLSSDENLEGESHKEPKDQAQNSSEQSENSMRLEDDSTLLDKAATEADTSFREPLIHDKKEADFDSFSTTCHGDFADELGSVEDPVSKSEHELKVTSGSQFGEEVKVDSPNKHNIDEEPTSSEVTGKTDHDVDNETSKEGQVNFLEREERPQSATIEEANMEPASSTEVVDSRPADSPRGNSDNLPTEQVILFD